MEVQSGVGESARKIESRFKVMEMTLNMPSGNNEISQYNKVYDFNFQHRTIILSNPGGKSLLSQTRLLFPIFCCYHRMLY